MIDVNELRKGVTFTMDGELFKVIEYQHYKPGRGKAVIRTRLRNLRSGSTIDKTFTSGDRVQDIRLDHQTVQYLYNDGEFYYFMDTETFEQFPLPNALLEDARPYLVENMQIELSSYEGEALDVELPITVDLEVIDAPPGFAGDTAQGATKEITLQTGHKVFVPLFISKGDVLRIDTRDGRYVTRV
ncbi:MAG: elongation factor P [Anaerolineae bacterium]|jgi:elongation factor P|nr:elongation factor P [Anaerolineae bacterium]MDX9832486.1 elongation factor P [Anaerolineae bacterium]